MSAHDKGSNPEPEQDLDDDGFGYRDWMNAFKQHKGLVFRPNVQHVEKDQLAEEKKSLALAAKLQFLLHWYDTDDDGLGWIPVWNIDLDLLTSSIRCLKTMASNDGPEAHFRFQIQNSTGSSSFACHIQKCSFEVHAEKQFKSALSPRPSSLAYILNRLFSYRTYRNRIGVHSFVKTTTAVVTASETKCETSQAGTTHTKNTRDVQGTLFGAQEA
ncbi:hypothetical protein OG21DRAFT_1604635 [Imleria badia]|nr:hypothetical protein OG21DRAFT_1604635 [Imleria badia]